MDDEKSIALLGSTGSIGRQAIEVARENRFRITAIAAQKNIGLLEEQIREFSPEYCAVFDEEAARDLKVRVADTPVKVLSGMDGLNQLAFEADCDILLNSLMGKCGILPTLYAIRSGKDIAMANKEPLVAAGEIILREAEEKNVRLLPVDSEHSAIFQCIDNEHNRNQYISRLIITASGGPFWGRTRQELAEVTPQSALRHPTWSMGAKITVDSATLMNKGLEVIEAVRLFGIDADRIDITVHRQSIVHSMVEFIDGSILAQLGHPDMKHCIQFALTYPERRVSLCRKMDFRDSFHLTFSPPDEQTFSLLPLAKYAVKRGGTVPAVMNGANEVAVRLFLENKIKFTDIFTLVEEATRSVPYEPTVTVDTVEAYDLLAREYVAGQI